MVIIMPKDERGGQGGASAKETAWNKRLDQHQARTGEDLRKRTIFDGLHVERKSNKYLTMDRVSKDGEKIVVNVAGEHLRKTPYGQALILDDNHVVYLKDFNVSINYFGNEVMLNKKYWKVTERPGYSNEFGENKANYSFSTWAKAAKAQKKTKVMWEDHYKSAKTKSIIKNIGK